VNATLIIAEVGSNYNNSLETAKTYIKAAKAAGANIVKFQTLRKDRLFSRILWVENKPAKNPVYDKVLNLELPDDWHFELKKTAVEAGVEFMSTPFYLEAVDLLERVGVLSYKIASGDITFVPLLERVGATRKPVFLSTGASDLNDVEKALEILRRSGAKEITLFHCVSSYPPAWNEMNLRAIVTLKERFGLPVGLSDHSPGYLASVMAVTLGATIIEKHVTFNRTLPGPDHPYAMTMDEFAEMVQMIRTAEQAMGNGEKKPSFSEMPKQKRIRRGLYDPRTCEKTDDAVAGIWLRPQYE